MRRTAPTCRHQESQAARNNLIALYLSMLNVDLRSTLLTLGNTRASSVLLSLNRNVNLLNVNCSMFGRWTTLVKG